MELITTILPAFTDERGAITNVVTHMIEHGHAIDHIAVITSKAGSIRGNHYHPRDDQWMYLLSGRYVSYTSQVVGNGKLADDSGIGQVVLPGQLAYCPPGIAHAYRFLEDSVFLNIAPAPRLGDESHTIPTYLTLSEGWPGGEGRISHSLWEQVREKLTRGDWR